MEISGLDVTLRRINQIERQFAILDRDTMQEQSSSFSNALNNAMEGSSDSSMSFTKLPEISSISSFSSSTNSLPDFEDIIKKQASENGVDENLLKALIKTESGFNPNARSGAGAMGLMQLMPATAQSLGVIDPYNPQQNIQGGTKYLKNLLSKYDGDKQKALAAYNAGPGAVDKYDGIPPYKETQNYVKKVLANESALNNKEAE